MQSSKIAIAGAAVLVIAGASWYVLSSPEMPPVAQAPAQTEATTQSTPQAEQQAPEPTKTSSNDQIIDYVVDGITKAESASAKQAIDAQVPASQADQAAALNTNF